MNQRLSYNFTFNILQHGSFATLSVVMYYQKNFFLAPAINDAIQKLQSAGLIEHWHYTFLKKDKMKIDGCQLAKLNIEQLRGAFEILVVGWSIGLLLLVVEIVLGKMTLQSFQ